MLDRILNWILDWLLARVGDVRAKDVRDETNKAAEDAQKRMDAVPPVARKSASDRLRDGSA